MGDHRSAAEKKATNTRFVSVLNGGIACSARPQLDFLRYLGEQGKCNAVFSLLGANEDPEAIQEVCGPMTWVHVPIKSASIRTIENPESFSKLQETIGMAKSMLSEGQKVFIHCAGGIHRTGVFTYTLLRMCGCSPEAARDTLGRIRETTLRKCGKHRLELGELLYQKLEHQIELEHSFLDFAAARDTDFLNQQERPLLWIKASLSPEVLCFSFLLSNSNLDKIVPGFQIFMRNPGLSNLLVKHRPLSQTPSELLSVLDGETSLLQYLQSSVCKQSCKLAGVNVHLEREIIAQHFPQVYAFLFYRVVELNSLLIGLGLSPITESSPLQDIATLQELRHSHFKDCGSN